MFELTPSRILKPICQCTTPGMINFLVLYLSYLSYLSTKIWFSRVIKIFRQALYFSKRFPLFEKQILKIFLYSFRIILITSTLVEWEFNRAGYKLVSIFPDFFVFGGRKTAANRSKWCQNEETYHSRSFWVSDLRWRLEVRNHQKLENLLSFFTFES